MTFSHSITINVAQREPTYLVPRLVAIKAATGTKIFDNIIGSLINKGNKQFTLEIIGELLYQGKSQNAEIMNFLPSEVSIYAAFGCEHVRSYVSSGLLINYRFNQPYTPSHGIVWFYSNTLNNGIMRLKSIREIHQQLIDLDRTIIFDDIKRLYLKFS